MVCFTKKGYAMRKIVSFPKIITGTLLSASLILLSLPDFPTAAAQSDDSLASFSTLHRVYDTEESGLIHYYYEDADGNHIELSDTEGTNSNNSPLHLKKAANLPSSYNLQDEGKTTSIKDQGMTGSCWSFAAIKSMESNLISKGIQTADNLDLSESHLAWYTYHPSGNSTDPLYDEGITYTRFLTSENEPFNEGGNALFAAFTLARWTGAVSESVAPFSADTNAALYQMISNMSEQSESLRYQKEYLLTDAVCYDNAEQSQIKEAIMENGAIDVSYYHEDTFFDKENNSYYQRYVKKKDAAEKANHSVSIIGWDDSYPKENFGTYKPDSDGAWLIANSYGDSFGSNGYSWISYEEPTLVEFYSFRAVPADTYDNNYQYDAYGYGNPVTNAFADTTKAANIFTANKNYNQILSAVSTYTISDNQPYTVQIYRGVTAGNPTSGTLAATVSGTAEFEGYHTIPLDKEIQLKAGERFSVVISYGHTNQNNGYVPLEGPSERDFSYRITYTSNAGESFLYNSTSNKWVDTNRNQANGIANNVCIKAFTRNIESLFLSDSKVILGKGEQYTLSATVRKAADNTVSYKSSNTSVATVSSSGKITAKAKGNVKITATLPSGTSNSVTVKVKSAPAKISVTPAQKKISRNQSFQIKTKLPSGSASNKITYSSSKPAVAGVSSAGKVTGKKKGTATITVRTYNNKTAKIKITVT